MTRVLLVSHELSRSGAPRVAQLVARGLVRDGYDVCVVAHRDGPLRGEFRAIAPTSIEPLWRVRRRLWGLPGPLGAVVARTVDTLGALVTIAASRPDVVYVNSTAAAVYLRPARWLRRRVILHVHESAEVSGRFLRAAGVMSLPDTVVACSPSVEHDLLASGVPATSVRLVLSVPDTDQVLERAETSAPVVGDGLVDSRWSSRERSERVETSAPVERGPVDSRWSSRERSERVETSAPASGALVVGCVGSVEARKGADLWPEIARRVHLRVPDVDFVWVGEGDAPATDDDRVHFLGASDNPYALVRTFDVATLPSRDDPFPLVVIEAMLLGRPVVAFDVGGVADQLGEAGVLVAAGDVSAFAEAVADLLLDDERRVQLGAAAEERARTEFSAQRFGERIVAVVEGASAANL